MNRIRFDSIGYDCIHVKGDVTTENRPMVINYGTWDNGAAAALATALRTAAGDIAAGCMGRTFVNLDDATGISLACRGWRMEMNLLLDTSVGNRPCVIRSNKGVTNSCRVNLDDFDGFAHADQGIVLIWAPDQPISYRIRSSSFNACRIAYLEEGGASKVCVPFFYEEDQTRASPAFYMVHGMYLGRNYMGNTDSNPNLSASFAHRRPGDTVSVLGTRMVAAGIGSSPQSAVTYVAGASLVITDTTVVCAAAEAPNIVIGAAIRIPGAGVAGADLDTIITDFDWNTYTITFDDAVSTAVGPVDIVNIPLVWA
jgi:hypothetical protein